MIKSNYLRGLCVAVAMFFVAFGAQAQRFETSLYFNGVLPVRQFNDQVNLVDVFDNFTPINRTDIAKGASAGLGATGRFGMWFDVGYGQLLPYVEASFLWNATKTKYRDIYDDNTKNDSLRATPVAPNYFNVPLLLGLKYRYEITPIIKPFLELSIGYDAMFVSSNGYRHNENTTNMWYSYKPTGAMAWSVGVGTYFGDNVSLGVYFVNFGSQRIEYTKRSDRPDADNYTVEKRKLGELGLRIGFHF